MTYTLDFHADKADVRTGPLGTIGFWVSAPAPGKGVAFGVLVDPNSCGQGVTAGLPPLPPPLHDPSFLALP